MDYRAINNNSDLLDFIKDLSTELYSHNYIELSKKIDYASSYANGSPSEFLIEVKTALSAVISENPNNINIEHIKSVVYIIDLAFIRVGGA